MLKERSRRWCVGDEFTGDGMIDWHLHLYDEAFEPFVGTT